MPQPPWLLPLRLQSRLSAGCLWSGLCRSVEAGCQDPYSAPLSSAYLPQASLLAAASFLQAPTSPCPLWA